MPGLPATYTRATLHFENTITTAKATCALYYLITAGTPPTLATIGTVASGFKTAYSAATAPTLNPDCRVTKVTVKYVSGGNEVEGDNTNGVIAGTHPSSDVLPEETVVCIQRRTGLVGRSKRGRIFWPFVTEDDQADGALTEDGQTIFGAVAQMVKSDVIASGITFKPHTLDHKNAVLVPIVQTGVVIELCSRRDRRFPKVLSAIHF